MSTAAVYPEGTAAAFALAAELGYDGVEVMVQTEPLSQDADLLADLMDEYQIPVLSVHSPCLLVTARVWSTDPLVKLARSIDMAERLGADTVVVHPPFLWQRAAAGNLRSVDCRTAGPHAGPHRGGEHVPGEGPRRGGQQLSAALESGVRPGIAGSPSICRTPRPPAPTRWNWPRSMGARLGHLHLADGSGSAKDEHLVPGRGNQPCAEILECLARNGFDGSVVVEISTRGVDREEREIDLAEALSFARLHLAAAI